MRSAIPEKIHKTHFGAGSCIRRAKVSLFWPGMTSDIKNKCMSCSVCAQYASQAPKEPMLSHDIEDHPWSLVSQDILMWEGKWHLVTTCHYSDWVEIDILSNTLTATVMEFTKAHFARFGIPDRLVTDNGPQFISTEYKQFATDYGFEHVTSSPKLVARKWQSRGSRKDCQEDVPEEQGYSSRSSRLPKYSTARTGTLFSSETYLPSHKGNPPYDPSASAVRSCIPCYR